MQDSDTYNDIKLCAFVVASNIYENGMNIYQSFIPLLETALDTIDSSKGITFLTFQNIVNDLYKVSIPKATLQRLLEELCRDGKIRYGKNQVIYATQNSNSIVLQEQRRKSQEISDLFLSFREYMLRNNKEISYEEAKNEICKYIFTHCYDLIDFIGGIKKPSYADEEKGEIICGLCDFLFECREKCTAQYKAFLNLYNGAVQSTLLNFNPDKIDSIQDDGLNLSKIVLDTNFVMRLLDIQTENEYVMALETYETLLALGVQFVILKNTLQEIMNSIKSFLNEGQPYVTDTRQYYQNIKLRSSGILSAIQRGKSRNELLQYTYYNKLKTAIESNFTIIIEEQYAIPTFLQEEVSCLITFKNRDGYAQPQAKHDLLLISYCKSLRDTDIESFKEAKCWVLTNDIKLTYWNQQNCDNIQECITETQISNLLWLLARKYDNLGLANTMIAIANNELLDQKTFFKFAYQMRKYKEIVKDNPEKIDRLSLVFACDSLTEEDIRKISTDPQEIDRIIFEKSEIIQENQKNVELSLSQNITEKLMLDHKLQLTNLTLDISNLENEILKTHNEVRESKNIKLDLQQKADKLDNLKHYIPRAGRETAIAIIIFSIICGIVIFVALLLFKKPIIDKLDCIKDLPGWVIELFLVIITPIVYALICLILLLFTGMPINPADIGKYFCKKRIEKYMAEHQIECDYEQVDIERKTLKSQINERSNSIIAMEEKIQDKEFSIGKKRQEIISLNLD